MEGFETDSMSTTPTVRRCFDALQSHPSLTERRQRSQAHVDRVRRVLSESAIIRDTRLAIFCAGSLARMESGTKSDLDLFVTAADSAGGDLSKRLFQITLFSELMKINEQLDFPPFSNDGEYLKVYFMDDLTSRIGSPRDDSDNLFTTRMLLMLESQPIAHEHIYRQHLHKILELYYRDLNSTSQFRPIFLLNDLLRYWRTMCLNYEERRHARDSPFRKKNVNLRFSRMLTVFGTVLPLIAEPADSVPKLKSLCAQTPLERLATGLDLLGDENLVDRWRSILDVYEEFLSWKERDDVEDFLMQQKATVIARAGELSAFLYDALTHENIQGEFRRHLIL